MHLDNFLDKLPEPPPAFHSFHLMDRNFCSGNRKRRRLSCPNPAMKLLHDRLLAHLRHLAPVLPSVTGCRPGCSPIKHVLGHRRQPALKGLPLTPWFNRYIYWLDLQRAYRSVRAESLAISLCALDWNLTGQEAEVAEWLNRYCFEPEGGLITGAPASPDLFNLCLDRQIDAPLRLLLGKFGLVYGRYLDDLVFSSETPINQTKRQAIRAVVTRAGFVINDRKSCYHDLERGPLNLNGLVIHRDGNLSLPGSTIKRLRGLLHLAKCGRLPNRSILDGTIGSLRALFDGHLRSRAESKLLKSYRDLYERDQTIVPF